MPDGRELKDGGAKPASIARRLPSRGSEHLVEFKRSAGLYLVTCDQFPHRPHKKKTSLRLVFLLFLCTLSNLIKNREL
jgi:hypothetical protein